MAGPPGKPKTGHKADYSFIIIVILVLIGGFFYYKFGGDYRYPLSRAKDFLIDRLHLDLVWRVIRTILYILLMFFTVMIAYCSVRMFEIRKKEKEHLEMEIEEYAHHNAEKEKNAQKGGAIKNERWAKIVSDLFSANPNDWKLAIIEADSMLDVLMDQLGFKGDNLGEKLKTADRDKFRSLSSAWEVHVVRNKIAHEGSQFQLSQHEAKRIVALYEQIFREFDYI